LCTEDGGVKLSRYWDVHYDIDFDHSPVYFRNRLIELCLMRLYCGEQVVRLSR
jgi:hypothetical protein